MDQLQAFKDLQEKNGFDIDGREYRFLPIPWEDGNDLLAYVSEIANDLESGVAGFLRTQDFKQNIRPMLFKYTTVDGHLLSGEGMKNHFDDNKSDYIQFSQLALQGLVSPFLPGSGTNSRSTAPEKTQVLSRKRT